MCQRLQKVQNYAARLVCQASYKDHVSPLLQSLHWLPVRARVTYKVLVLTYQAIHGLAPEYLQQLVTVYEPNRNLRSQHELRLVVPRYKTVTYGGKSFKAAAALLWNLIPTELRNSPSLNSFKHCLKTHLFKSEFSV